jgi:hypothetical protein
MPAGKPLPGSLLILGGALLSLLLYKQLQIQRVHQDTKKERSAALLLCVGGFWVGQSNRKDCSAHC